MEKKKNKKSVVKVICFSLLVVLFGASLCLNIYQYLNSKSNDDTEVAVDDSLVVDDSENQLSSDAKNISLEMSIGDSYNFKEILDNSNYSESIENFDESKFTLKYNSDSKVVSVNDKGVFTGVASGNTTIYAIYDKVEYDVSISIKEVETSNASFNIDFNNIKSIKNVAYTKNNQFYIGVNKSQSGEISGVKVCANKLTDVPSHYDAVFTTSTINDDIGETYNAVSPYGYKINKNDLHCFVFNNNIFKKHTNEKVVIVIKKNIDNNVYKQSFIVQYKNGKYYFNNNVQRLKQIYLAEMNNGQKYYALLFYNPYGKGGNDFTIMDSISNNSVSNYFISTGKYSILYIKQNDLLTNNKGYNQIKFLFNSYYDNVSIKKNPSSNTNYLNTVKKLMGY